MNLRSKDLMEKLGLKFGSEVQSPTPFSFLEIEATTNDSYSRTWWPIGPIVPKGFELSTEYEAEGTHYRKRVKTSANQKLREALKRKTHITVESEYEEEEIKPLF